MAMNTMNTFKKDILIFFKMRTLFLFLIENFNIRKFQLQAFLRPLSAFFKFLMTTSGPSSGHHVNF